LDLIGTTDIEVLSDDLFEQRAATGRTIQDLGQTELGLEDGELIAVAGPLIGGRERVGQALQPLPGEGLDLGRREAVT
jgi:hypothetical protein